MIQVADSAHIGRAMQATDEILKRNTLFLPEPPAMIELFQVMGPVITIRVRVWIKGKDLNSAVQVFMNAIREIADKESMILAASFNDK